MGVLAASWETLDAEAAMAGTDLLTLPPVRLLNIVWSRLRASKSDEEWRKTLMEITRPLPGRAATPALKTFRRRHMP